MLLAIDIGNTNTVIGCFRGAELAGSFRIQSARAYTTDEAGILCRQLIEHHVDAPQAIDSVAICSVVPALTAVYENMSRIYFNCESLTLRPGDDLGLTLAVGDPTQVGADRLANALAARDLYGTPAVVVDFGTATTFDVLAADGTYMGGVIAPGVITSSAELSRRAAQLFGVRIEKPAQLIGSNTAAAMQAGIYYGTVGQVLHILRSIEAELGTRPVVIATGGLAELWRKGVSAIDHVDLNLTLQGLRLFCDRRGQASP
jgi:type III pantothenate kinase